MYKTNRQVILYLFQLQQEYMKEWKKERKKERKKICFAQEKSRFQRTARAFLILQLPITTDVVSSNFNQGDVHVQH